MTITTIRENDQITLKLDGWLDTLSAPELEAVAETLEPVSALILDFDQVEYISSAGLRQVVACSKKAKELNASFAVINAHTETMSIFQLTGIDKKLDIRKK